MQNFIRQEAVRSDLRASSKKAVLNELAEILATETGLDAGRCFDVLLERERLSSTGLGRGVAVPHGRIAGLNRVVGVFARLKHKIDFDAIDAEPVDLVFALLAPAESGADHLTALARISRLLRQRDFCEKLRGADGDMALYALLMNAETEQAA